MTRPTHSVDYTCVKQAYDTVADDYAAHLPDTRAEAALDLAMLDHFAATVETGGGPILDAGCGAGRINRVPGRPRLRLATGAVRADDHAPGQGVGHRRAVLGADQVQAGVDRGGGTATPIP